MGEGRTTVESVNLGLGILRHWERLGVTDEFILENYDADLRDNVLFSITDAVTPEDAAKFMGAHPILKALFLDYSLKRGVVSKSYQNKLRQKREAEGK